MRVLNVAFYGVSIFAPLAGLAFVAEAHGLSPAWLTNILAGLAFVAGCALIVLDSREQA